MKRFLLILTVFGLVLGSGFAQTSSEPGGKPAQKAKTMVKEGIKYWKSHSADESIAAYNNTSGKFRDGEYYLFVFDIKKPESAICIARGDGNKALIGKDLWTNKDSDGQLYYQAFVKAAKSKEGYGWVDYKRTNPESKKIEPKSSYIELIPGTSIFVGCGFYSYKD